MRRHWFVVPLLLACAMQHVLCATLDSLALERRALQEQMRAAQAQCHTRFAVNACLSALEQDQRTRLAALRAQELQLQAVQRAQRTQEQLQRLEEKQTEQARRIREADGQRSTKSVKERIPNPLTSGSSLQRDHSLPSSKLTPEQESAHQTAYLSKLENAQQHKIEVRKRLAEQKQRASSLPEPP